MPSPEPTTGAEQANPALAERRAFVRLASDLAATCHPPIRGKEVSWPGRVQNISQGGVGLLMQHRFRPGTALTVELRKNTGALLRAVAVSVVHVQALNDDGNHCWLLGCAFGEPLTDDELQDLL